MIDLGKTTNIVKIRTSKTLVLHATSLPESSPSRPQERERENEVVLHGVSNVTQTPFDRHTTAARQGTYVPVLECLVTGPHIRTVPSSLDEAIIVGSLGFQLTQFTVFVCPLRTATGFSRFECQMYTLLSEIHSLKLLNAMYMYGLITNQDVNMAGN